MYPINMNMQSLRDLLSPLVSMYIRVSYFHNRFMIYLIRIVKSISTIILNYFSKANLWMISWKKK